MSNQYIIPRQQQPVLNTYNYKYPPGTLNYTDPRITTRHICVDTLFRQNYDDTTCTDFLYILSEPINNVISMKLSAIEFPNSWFIFSSHNQSNEFTIKLYNLGTINNFTYASVMTHTIIIPHGNYVSGAFQSGMNNLFFNTKGGLEYIHLDVDEITTCCTIRTKIKGDDSTDTTNKYTNNNLPIDFYFTVDFKIKSDPNRPLYKNAGWTMGFREAFYTVRVSNIGYSNIMAVKPTITTTTLGGIFSNLQTITPEATSTNWMLTSESSYGSTIVNYVYLDVDDYNKNYATNTFASNTINDSYLGNTILGRISVSSNINTIITNTEADLIFKKREYFGPVKIERLRIRLLNRFGEPIDLNHNDYSLMLDIEQLYS